MDIVKDFKNYFFNFDNEEEILTHEDLVNVSERLLENKFSMENMEDSIQNLKTRLLGGSADSYSFGNVTTLVQWGQRIFEQLYFNEVTYSHFREILDGWKPP